MSFYYRPLEESRKRQNIMSSVKVTGSLSPDQELSEGLCGHFRNGRNISFGQKPKEGVKRLTDVFNPAVMQGGESSDVLVKNLAEDSASFGALACFVFGDYFVFPHYGLLCAVDLYDSIS